MVRPKKIINVEVDSRMLAIQSQKEKEEQEQLEEFDSFYIPTLERRSIRNISVHYAMEILTQQMKLSGLRKRTINDYNYQFNRFAEMVRVVKV